MCVGKHYSHKRKRAVRSQVHRKIVRLSTSKGKDEWEEEFLLIKSVTGKYLRLEKLRLGKQCLAANIFFPSKFCFHCLCTKHSPGTKLHLECKPTVSLFFFHSTCIPSPNALQVHFFPLSQCQPLMYCRSPSSSHTVSNACM